MKENKRQHIRENMTNKMGYGKKIWWIWKLIIYHVECSESYRLCRGENWTRRTLSMWIRCTMTRLDPQLWWLAPNYVWIDIFITCFHAHCSHSNQVEHWIFEGTLFFLFFIDSGEHFCKEFFRIYAHNISQLFDLCTS